MGLNCWSNFVILFFVCVCSTSADDTSTFNHRLEATEELVKALSNRVDLLEAREKVHLDRIVELESRDNRQQETIYELQKQLQENRHSAPLDVPLPTMENNTTHNEAKTNPQKVSGGILHTSSSKRDKGVQRIRQADSESPIVFSALLGSHFQNAGVKQILVFDNVVTNIGTHYNPSVGTFTAPLEGAYVFSTTLVTYSSTNDHASFYRNADKINTMYVHGTENGWATTSSTLTFHLQKGDVVTVRNGDNNGAYWGDNHGSFSGFLLSSYINSPSVIGK